MRRFSILLVLALTLLAGCGSKQVIKTANEDYILKELSINNLKDDVFYVARDGVLEEEDVEDDTAFYEVYMPKGTLGNELISTVNSLMGNNERILWVDKDKDLIPTMYRDDIIAYVSKKEALEDITLERFKSAGYSFGLYGGTIDEDGYLVYSVKDNMVDNSSAKKYFSSLGSENILIVSIDGQSVSSDTINSSGIIKNLPENSTHTITFYAGTYYGEVDITADEEFFISTSTISDANVSMTQKGYLSIEMPQNAQSGYYLINGKGIFRYYNYSYGEASGDVYSGTLSESADVSSGNSQQFSLNIDEKTNNVKITVSYEYNSETDEDISCVLTSPDGTTYNLKTENAQSTISLTQVKGGKWKVNIMPVNVTVTGINVDSFNDAASAIRENYSFTLDTQANIEFYVLYKGEGDVWGVVKDSTGEAKSFGDAIVYEENEEDEQTQDRIYKISAKYPYLTGDTYTLTIYHRADTTIKEVNYKVSDDATNQEVITVEE